MQKMMMRGPGFLIRLFYTALVGGRAVTGTAASTSQGPGTTTPPFWDDDANGDPFTDVAVAPTTILQNTRMMPNLPVLYWSGYQPRRQSPPVNHRHKRTQPTFASTHTTP